MKCAETVYVIERESQKENTRSKIYSVSKHKNTSKDSSKVLWREGDVKTFFFFNFSIFGVKWSLSSSQI